MKQYGIQRNSHKDNAQTQGKKWIRKVRNSTKKESIRIFQTEVTELKKTITALKNI